MSVQVVQVKRSFNGTIRVLNGVNLDVQPGEMVALYGPSGSGKTTLLNLIGALDYPDEGEISIGGRDITRLSERARTQLRRQAIGFIFQSDTLVPTYNALENIELGLRVAGIGYRERRRRSKAAIEAVGLAAWATHMPEELSGGQRQRISIARALALRPLLFLADEPTNGLDTRTSHGILTLFQGIARQQGSMFLIVSHDPLVVDYVDHAYDLNNGLVRKRYVDTVN